MPIAAKSPDSFGDIFVFQKQYLENNSRKNVHQNPTYNSL